MSFNWRDKAYRISEIIFRSSHENVKNKKMAFHVHVKADSETDYQLIVNIETLIWKLGFIQRHRPDDDFLDD